MPVAPSENHRWNGIWPLCAIPRARPPSRAGRRRRFIFVASILVGNLQRTQRRFLRPKPDTAEYATKALATAKAVREAEPSATIIASAMPGFDWKYMKNFLQSGVLDLFGGVSVHPYRPPESTSGHRRCALQAAVFEPAELDRHVFRRRAAGDMLPHDVGQKSGPACGRRRHRIGILAANHLKA